MSDDESQLFALSEQRVFACQHSFVEGNYCLIHGYKSMQMIITNNLGRLSRVCLSECEPSEEKETHCFIMRSKTRHHYDWQDWPKTQDAFLCAMPDKKNHL